MANPGLGYKTACDVLMEVSFHLLQPTVFTTITSLTDDGGGVYTIGVNSTNAMYPGALVVVGWKNVDAEIVSVTSVTDDTHFVATLVNTHSTGETILGPTFPIQQPTDPIFTQSEMLAYLARAQNEFLTAVPCYYQRFFQTVNQGIVLQDTPPTSILVDRVAASLLNFPIASLSRAGNVATLTTNQDTGLSQYSTFSIVNTDNNLTDTTFEGVFAVTEATNSGGNYFLTYRQAGADASATGGRLQSMYRLYELTQEELVQRQRNWRTDYQNWLKTWFEDRSGLYRWGVGGLPSTNFPVELLCAVRDTDTLALTDGFLLPDMLIHGLKYLVLHYAWSKDGVNQQPTMAQFALQRYSQVVLAAQRYVQAMKIGTKP